MKENKAKDKIEPCQQHSIHTLENYGNISNIFNNWKITNRLTFALININLKCIMNYRRYVTFIYNKPVLMNIIFLAPIHLICVLFSFENCTLISSKFVQKIIGKTKQPKREARLKKKNKWMFSPYCFNQYHFVFNNDLRINKYIWSCYIGNSIIKLVNTYNKLNKNSIDNKKSYKCVQCTLKIF